MNFKALKMDGLGNDFLIIDNRDQKIHLNQDQILKLSDKKNNIGFDQLIYIENSNDADAELKYFNSDGKKLMHVETAIDALQTFYLRKRKAIKLYLKLANSYIMERSIKIIW